MSPFSAHSRTPGGIPCGLRSLSSDSGSVNEHEPLANRPCHLEAETEATAELGTLPEASLETQFKALEAGSSVDAELEALKQKMALAAGSSAGPRAIAAGDDDLPADELEADLDPPEAIDPKAAEVDAQLEELKRKLSST